jgi:hypothetical protein
MKLTLFKVLGKDGQAIWGGNGRWSLPQGSKPGEWMELAGRPRCCVKGFHLVADPLPWWFDDARLFLAEADTSRPFDLDRSDKGAFNRVRLLCEITPDWELLPLYPRVAAFLALSNPTEISKRNLWLDFSFSSIENKDMSRISCYRFDMRATEIVNLNLGAAVLNSANFDRCNIFGMDCWDAKITCGSFLRAEIRESNFRNADLSYTDFGLSHIIKTPFAGATLRYTWFSGAKIEECSFFRATLEGADLSNTQFRKVDLRGCDLRRCNLSGTAFTECNLEGAQLPDSF